MQEPSPRTSRLAIAGSLAALLAAGGGGFLLGRATPPAAPPPPPPAAPVSAPTPTAPAKPEERLLSRADLIAIGNAAADAAASGRPIAAPTDATAGQRFELFLPFGCDGPSPAGSDAPLQWRYEAEDSTLRIRVTPASWAPADWWQAVPAGVEGLEGFWISRPWSSAEACPTGRAAPTPDVVAPIVLPAETLGIAQLVTRDTPRQLSRDGKPYESVTRLAPDALSIEQGLRVRVRGRLAEFSEGQMVRCTQPGGRAQRPVCLVAVTIDEIAVENPAAKKDVAVWAPTAGNPAG